MTNFGDVELKIQGRSYSYGIEYPESLGNTKTHWMELPLENRWDRERVIQEVKEWLEDCGWTTHPTKNPNL